MSSTPITAAAVPAARVAAESSAAALPGTPFPLGATPGEQAGIVGTNFAIASAAAAAVAVAVSVTLCLFDETGAEIRILV
jgi:hypothetical protein